ncbi:class I SAM-dependent methyltransferase [Lacunimicrobium album]
MAKQDPNSKHWQSYTNIQKVKHDLIRNYLNGWLPKMTLGATGAKQLLYIDTHAGRGRYDGGSIGSPVVALNSLLNHIARDKILVKCKVTFIFLEKDSGNLEQLNHEISKTNLPKNLEIETAGEDSFDFISKILDRIASENKVLPPSFTFIDPFGFKIPGSLIKRLLAMPQSEVMVNMMWREIDMEISQALKNPESKYVETLDLVFAGTDWRSINSPDRELRADQCANLLHQVSEAKWSTIFRMKERNQCRYFLQHFTRHDAGRDLIKNCMWKSSPSGGFYASKSTHPEQQLLIDYAGPVNEVKSWLLQELDKPRTWEFLVEATRQELWLESHLTSACQELFDEKQIETNTGKQKFVKSENPTLRKCRSLFG